MMTSFLETVNQLIRKGANPLGGWSLIFQSEENQKLWREHYSVSEEDWYFWESLVLDPYGFVPCIQNFLYTYDYFEADYFSSKIRIASWLELFFLLNGQSKEQFESWVQQELNIPTPLKKKIPQINSKQFFQALPSPFPISALSFEDWQSVESPYLLLKTEPQGETLLDAIPPQCKKPSLKHLKNHENIVYLNLSETDSNDLELEALSELKKLQVLDLSNSRVTNQGLTFLQGLKDLTVLSLASLPIDNQGIKSLLPLTQLRWLNLSSNRLGRDGLFFLHHFQELTALNLTGIPLKQEDLPFLAALKNLKKLDLSNTQIGDFEVKWICRNLHSLEDLSVANTQITEYALADFQSLPSLKRLLIHNNNVGDIERSLRGFSHCRVIWNFRNYLEEKILNKQKKHPDIFPPTSPFYFQPYFPKH